MTVRQRRGGASGVTLIELLVALALVGVVMAAAGTMLLQAYENEAAYREQNEAQQNARTAVDFVTDDLRRALPRPGLVVSGYIVPVPVYEGTGTNSNRLRFSVLDDNGNPRTVSYWFDPDRNLRRQIGDQDNVVVARNVTRPSSLAFIDPKPSALSPSGALVSVTATVGRPARQSSVTVRSLVYFRNVLLPGP